MTVTDLVRPVHSEPNRAMILVPPRDVPPTARPGGAANSTWGFVLEPITEHSTRLIMRGRGESSPRLRDRVIGYAFWEPAHFIMERRMMLSIKDRVERSNAAAASTDVSSAQPVAP